MGIVRPPLVVEKARKNSVAVQRFKIFKSDAETVRKIEAAQGHQEAAKFLLSLLMKGAK